MFANTLFHLLILISRLLFVKPLYDVFFLQSQIDQILIENFDLVNLMKMYFFSASNYGHIIAGHVNMRYLVQAFAKCGLDFDLVVFIFIC